MPDDPPRKKRRRHTNAELEAIDQAIIAAVQSDRPVTLRGVFYRVVSAGMIEKTDSGYGVIQRELLRLRRFGEVSYSDIRDGSRFVLKPRTWDSMEAALRNTADTYRRSRWHEQGIEVQVYSEKDAITSILQPVTARYDVPLGIARGYASETFAWDAAQSILGLPGSCAEVWCYQLGDHDASGVNGWATFAARVAGFVAERYSDADDWLHFERLAVTPAQITAMNLPTRIGKPKDPRNPKFMAANRAAGLPPGTSVEVDAIPAPVLRRLLEDAIESHIDQPTLDRLVAQEADERELLHRMTGPGLRDWLAQQDEEPPGDE